MIRSPLDRPCPGAFPASPAVRRAAINAIGLQWSSTTVGLSAWAIDRFRGRMLCRRVGPGSRLDALLPAHGGPDCVIARRDAPGEFVVREGVAGVRALIVDPAAVAAARRFDCVQHATTGNAVRLPRRTDVSHDGHRDLNHCGVARQPVSSQPDVRHVLDAGPRSTRSAPVAPRARGAWVSRRSDRACLVETWRKPGTIISTGQADAVIDRARRPRRRLRRGRLSSLIADSMSFVVANCAWLAWAVVRDRSLKRP